MKPPEKVYFGWFHLRKMKICRHTPHSSGFYENHTPRNSSGTHVFFQVEEFYRKTLRHETRLSLVIHSTTQNQTTHIPQGCETTNTSPRAEWPGGPRLVRGGDLVGLRRVLPRPHRRAARVHLSLPPSRLRADLFSSRAVAGRAKDQVEEAEAWAWSPLEGTLYVLICVYVLSIVLIKHDTLTSTHNLQQHRRVVVVDPSPVVHDDYEATRD